MYDVVTIGSATHDVLVNVKEAKIVEDEDFNVGKGICLPFGSKILINKLTMASGGGGTNAAVTFARQGFHTACVSLVGQDPNGREILDEMRRENVDAKWIQVHDDDLTAYSFILVGPAGERTILSYKGEGMHWNVQNIPWDQIESKWLYVNSLAGHLELLERLTQLARDKGIHLATNPGSKEVELGLEKLAPLWKSFDIIGMNQEEASDLTGLDFKDEDAIFKKLDEIIGGIFIMTRGNEGCVVSDGQFIYSAGVPKADVIERTGAGDAFHSGFLAEFIRSGNIEKAIQFATANASSVVMHYGAKEGILRKDQTVPWPTIEVERRQLRG